MGERRLLALVRGHRMKRLLARMLDPGEFLSEYGIRAISRYHLEQPYRLEVDGSVHEVRYEPGESSTGLFGGNSNWRGPIWFPINFLLVEALQKFHHYYGDDFLIESPTGSARCSTLWQIAADISRRLESHLPAGRERPTAGVRRRRVVPADPHWRDHVPFHEYFHGDSGRGVGASHQTAGRAWWRSSWSRRQRRRPRHEWTRPKAFRLVRDDARTRSRTTWVEQLRARSTAAAPGLLRALVPACS